MTNQRSTRKKAKPPTKARPAPGIEAIESLLERGEPESALELAKLLQRGGLPRGTEQILLRAYRARFDSLLRSDQARSAAALLEEMRCLPIPGPELQDLELRIAARADVDLLIQRWRDPAIRPAVERAITTDLVDLEALATSTAVPAADPLGRAATALCVALEAVTSGAVRPDQVELAEVSRKSPLAPWKLLVKAIARYYQGDDEECRRLVRAIDPGSAAAALSPVLLALLGEHERKGLDAPAKALVRAVAGHVEVARKTLAQLDRALQERSAWKVLRGVGEARLALASAPAEAMEAFRRSVGVRCRVLEIDAAGALGEPPRPDAAFWRLMAVTYERGASPLLSVALWEEFLGHAVLENWFLPDALEVAAVRLRQASLLEALPPGQLAPAKAHFSAAFHGFSDFYPGTSSGSQAVHREAPYLDGDWLYRSACAADPVPETFQRWLDWADRSEDGGISERVAAEWHRRHPEDARPLLAQVRMAERRGALKKAAEFADLAAAAACLHPEARQAQLRTRLATALRHIKQRKPELLRKDCLGLAGLPALAPADAGVLLDGLDWVCAHLSRQPSAERDAFARLSAALGGELPARLLVRSILLSGSGVPQPLGAPKAPSGPGSLSTSSGRVLGLGRALGLAWDLPKEWEAALLQDARKGRSKLAQLEDRALFALCGAAAENDWVEVGYAFTSVGIARGGPALGYYLLERADVLPAAQHLRSLECVAAAVVLGKAEQDSELIGRAIERARLQDPDVQPSDLSLTPEQMERILERERLDLMASEKRPLVLERPLAVEWGGSGLQELLEMLGQVSGMDRKVLELLGMPPELATLLDACADQDPEALVEAMRELQRFAGLPHRPKPGRRKRQERRGPEPGGQGALFEEVAS